MDTVKKLQDLWRHRRYVACVCVLAVLAAVLVTFMSPSYDVGTASAQVLVDTQRSQVVGASSSMTAAGGQALGTLGTQANLLADLMVEGTIKAEIAQSAGLKPNQLIGVSAAVSVPSSSGPSSVSVPSGPNVFALTTQILTDNAGFTTLPIIEIDAHAPDRDKAVRLASAAVAGLQAFVNSQAADERIPTADRLSIMSLGISQATTQTSGSSPLIGVVVALVVLLLGCASILWILALIRGWRSAAERERLGLAEPLEDEPEWMHYEVASPAEPAVGGAVAANGVSQRHAPTNGVSQRHTPTNGVSQHDVPADGVSGNSNHGATTPGAHYPSFATGDTSGQDPAASSRRWSSRRWSSRQWSSRQI